MIVSLNDRRPSSGAGVAAANEIGRQLSRGGHPSFVARVLQKQRRLAAAAVELAVILPLIAFLFAVAVDYARAFYFTQVLSTCSRNGAIYAADDTAAADSPYSSIEEAAKADAPSFMRDQLTVSNESQTNSSNTTVTVTVSYEFDLITKMPGMPASQTFSRSVEMYVIPAVPD